nr:hypothetical protein Itr_chr14CG27400 [Ipomoea trifida]
MGDPVENAKEVRVSCAWSTRGAVVVGDADVLLLWCEFTTKSRVLGFPPSLRSGDAHHRTLNCG